MADEGCRRRGLNAPINARDDVEGRGEGVDVRCPRSLHRTLKETSLGNIYIPGNFSLTTNATVGYDVNYTYVVGDDYQRHRWQCTTSACTRYG